MCITHMITVPDDLVLSVVTRRLSSADCTAQGWVLHGFPLTGNQAELLTQAGHKPNRYACMCIMPLPNALFKAKFLSLCVPSTLHACIWWLCKFYRVFFLELPEESIKERLTLRRLDPITGERYECDNNM